MFTGGGHTGFAHPADQRCAQRTDNRRAAVKRTITYHAAQAALQIEHRCKARIDTARQQLTCHQPAELLGQVSCLVGVAVVQRPQRRHRRQTREPVTKPLYAPTLLIHRDEQTRLAQRMNRRAQALQLLGIGVVAVEQHDAADQRMTQHLSILHGELGAGHIDHQRTKRHIGLRAAYALTSRATA